VTPEVGLPLLEGVTSLDVDYNDDVVKIRLDALESLEYLSISGCDLLTGLDLPNLTVLEIWGNPLGDRALDEQLPALEARGVKVGW